MPAREGDASKLSRIYDPLTSTRATNQRRQFSLTQAAFEGDSPFSCQPTSPWSTAIGGMCSQAHGNDVTETNQFVPPTEKPYGPAIDDDYVSDENDVEDIWMNLNRMRTENRTASGPGLLPGLQTLGTVSSTYDNLGARPKTSATLSTVAIRTDPPHPTSTQHGGYWIIRISSWRACVEASEPASPTE